MSSPTYKKLGKIAAFTAGGLMVLLLGLHLYITWNARSIIRDIVNEESHGKVKVEIGNIGIRYFHPPTIDARNVRLNLMDSTGQHAVYSINIGRLFLSMNSLRSLISQKKFLVEQILAENPSIQVFPQYKPKKKEGNSALVFELGNVYETLDRIANKLEVKNIKITRGDFAIDNFQPGNTPARIRNIDFRLDNFKAPEAGVSDSSKFMYTDNIGLNTGKLELLFPDGRHGLSYTALTISTRDRDISIDSAHVFSTGQDSAFNALDLYFDKLRLINLDFASLYHAEKIKVDTVFCLNPAVTMKLDLTKKTTTRDPDEADTIYFHGTREGKRNWNKRVKGTRGDESPFNQLSTMLGHLDIGFIDLQNSRIALTTKNKEKVTPFTTRGNNFQISGLMTGVEGEQPIQVKKVAFAIKNYRAFSADSMYQVRFDSVVYDNRNLFLKNFTLGPSDRNTARDAKIVTIPLFELRNLSLNEVVAHQRLKAEELMLLDPVTRIYHFDSRPNAKAKPLTAIIAEVNKRIEIGKVTMINGDFLSQSLEDPRKKIAVHGINSSIDARELLEAPSYELMGQSIGKLEFTEGLISGARTEVILRDAHMNGTGKLVQAGTLEYRTTDSSITAVLSHARIKGYQFDNDLHTVAVDSIGWDAASIHYKKHKGNTAPATAAKTGQKPDWKVNALYTHGTSLDLDLGDTKVNGTVDALAMTGAHSNGNDKPSFTTLDLALSKAGINSPYLQGTLERLILKEDGASRMEGLVLNYARDGDTARIQLPRTDFTPHLNDIIAGRALKMDNLVLERPQIRAFLSREPSTSSEDDGKEPMKIDIASLDLRGGDVDLATRRGGKHMHLSLDDLFLNVKDIRAGDDKRMVSIGPFRETLARFELNSNDSLRLGTEKGGVELAGMGMTLWKGGTNGKGQVSLTRARVSGLHMALLSAKRNKPLELSGVSMGVDDLSLDSLEKNHIARRIKANPNLFVRNINLADRSDKHDLAAFGIRYENRDHMLSADSFHYRPAMDKDSFNRMQQWQKDYMQAWTGAISIRGIDVERLIRDSVFHAEKITVHDALLDIYKDKRLPYHHDIIKPLPTDMLVNKVKFGIVLDTLRLREGELRYGEFNDKTNAQADIFLTDLNLQLTDIRNRDITPTDSLRLVAYMNFLDTSAVRFHFRESYTDSLHGFLMSLRAAPMPLTALNSFLPQMASARINSGHMDTLRMRAIGREYLAYGYMQLFYRDLKIQYLNKGDVLKKTFLTKMITFFANNLVLRKNNQKRTGRIYFERLRDRSFVNYWIKIVLSGALTNAGVKENAGQDRKYKKKLKKLQVPEIPNVDF